MRRTTRKRAIVLAAAVCCATAIAVGIELASDVILKERGSAQATLQARETLARAEARLQRAAVALTDLVAAEVKTCRQADIEAMRRAVYTTTPVKEAAVIDGHGAVLCSHHGFGSDHRGLTAEHPVNGFSAGITMSMVRFGDGQEPALRLRALAGPPHLAVLVPAEAFETDDVANVAQGLGFRLVLAGLPSVVREAGEPSPHDVRVSVRSGRFPVEVEIVRSARSLKAGAQIPVLYARAGGVVVSFLLIALALSSTRPRHDPADELRAAIEAGQIIPYYQPVMDIVSGQLIGCEVLARWRKPDGELVSPGVFIPLAESSGLIFDLTLALMRAARNEVEPHYAGRADLKLSFNVHADHFIGDRIVTDVREVFGHTPLRLSQVVLEVTERAPLADLADARLTIAALQALGVKVAIDDVGTGHGGLSYLLKLGVDMIKIDKMFIDAIGTERYSNTIIDTLVELGRSMAMDVIAEGVESFDQVEHLRDHGIRIAQGHVFAPALPGSAYLDLVEAMCRKPGDPEARRTPLPRYISARSRHFG